MLTHCFCKMVSGVIPDEFVASLCMESLQKSELPDLNGDKLVKILLLKLLNNVADALLEGYSEHCVIKGVNVLGNVNIDTCTSLGLQIHHIIETPSNLVDILSLRG